MSDDALVYVVDDDAQLRDSMRWLIESVGFAVETFSNPNEFMAAYDSERTAVLVLDVRMPQMSGLELQAKLQSQHIAIPVIFISGHASVPIAVEAMKSGAVEFLTKPFNDQVLLDSINRSMAYDKARREADLEIGFIRERLARLTKREHEILNLVVAAKSSKAIAAELGISYKTVELHRSRIIEKMEVASAMELSLLINKLAASKAEAAV